MIVFFCLLILSNNLFAADIDYKKQRCEISKIIREVTIYYNRFIKKKMMSQKTFVAILEYKMGVKNNMNQIITSFDSDLRHYARLNGYPHYNHDVYNILSEFGIESERRELESSCDRACLELVRKAYISSQPRKIVQEICSMENPTQEYVDYKYEQCLE